MVPLLLLAFLALAAGVFLGIVHVFFRDVGHVLGIVLQVWFWLTPIVYAASLAPQTLRRWLQFNPMLHFVTAYQDIVTKHAVPSAATFALLAALAVVSLATGWTVFGRAQKRFAEYV